MELEIDKEEVGNRLFKIRHVLGEGTRGGQKSFAKKLGASNGTYSKWETGEIKLPVEYAVKLMAKLPGLTLDWIYLGGFDRLRDKEAARLLAEAPDRERVAAKESLPDKRAAAELLAPLPRATRRGSRKRVI
jgi:transcriptional regulator with XRE-family HTH domain